MGTARRSVALAARRSSFLWVKGLSGTHLARVGRLAARCRRRSEKYNGRAKALTHQLEEVLRHAREHRMLTAHEVLERRLQGPQLAGHHCEWVWKRRGRLLAKDNAHRRLLLGIVLYRCGVEPREGCAALQCSGGTSSQGTAKKEHGDATVGELRHAARGVLVRTVRRVKFTGNIREEG